jgi:hypothetical protein
VLQGGREPALIVGMDDGEQVLEADGARARRKTKEMRDLEAAWLYVG